MPLKTFAIPDGPENIRLPFAVMLTAFLCGAFFILFPVPQLTICSGNNLKMLLSAWIAPLGGIASMGYVLKMSGISNAFQLRNLDKKDLFVCVSGTLGIIIFSALATFLWKQLLTSLKIEFTEQQNLILFAKNLHGIEFWLFALLVTIPYPIAEELFYRRIIYPGLLPAGKILSLTITALAFSVSHLFLAGVPGLFIVGAGFQLLYLYRKNLLAAIISHALFNAAAVVSTLFAD